MIHRFKINTCARSLLTVGLPLMAVALGGCDYARSALGYDRKNPDAYKVVDRAPLCMPPDFALRPPKPGAPRPQEKSAKEQAEEALMSSPASISSIQTHPSEGEKTLLTQAGEADPAVRAKIDEEHTRSKGRKLPPLAKKLGLKELDEDTVIDPIEEAKKLSPQKKTPQE